MAEDTPPQSSESEARSTQGQSAVARLLLAGSGLPESVEESRGSSKDAATVPSDSLISVEIVEEQSFETESIDAASPGGLDGLDGDDNFSQSELSPDGYAVTASSLSSSGRLYSCRFCDFSTMTYTHLQLHMPRHGGLKALKCGMCDYSTNDKSNFRRHRRLHQRNNPATVLHCGKCDFSTVLPRKIREHYSRDHGEEYGSPGPPLPPSPPIVRIQGYRAEHINDGRLDLSQGHGSANVIPVSSGSIHPLIGAAPAGMHIANPQLIRNCVAQYHPYEVPIHQSSHESHMASDYLRSIVSNIITSHHTPRIPAASTITSSSFYLPPSMGAGHVMPASSSHSIADRHASMDQSDDKVKVKNEPVSECEGVSDVTSSATMFVRARSDVTQQMEAETTRRLSFNAVDHRMMDRNNEATSSVDLSTFINSTEVAVSIPESDRTSNGSSGSVVRVKQELSNVGIQCVLPLVKAEPIDFSETSGLLQTRKQFSDCGVQCELLSSGRRFGCRSVPETLTPEQAAFLNQHSKCPHCGVTFDDEVLFSIHIGCHSHTDPFVCNVCGKPCHNKYGFYSHIMRGHQF